MQQKYLKLQQLKLNFVNNNKKKLQKQNSKINKNKNSNNIIIAKDFSKIF